jgi:hypothetical protein
MILDGGNSGYRKLSQAVDQVTSGYVSLSQVVFLTPDNSG